MALPLLTATLSSNGLKSNETQLFLLHHAELQTEQVGVGVGGKMVELDLRMNEITSIDRLAASQKSVAVPWRARI